MRLQRLGKVLLLSATLTTAGCAADTEGDEPTLGDDGDALPAESSAGVDGEEDATTDDDVGTVSSAASAPSCLEFRSHTSRGYMITRTVNRCRTNQRFRLIWRWSYDGECIMLRPGGFEWWDQRRTRPAFSPYVSEIRKC